MGITIMTILLLSMFIFLFGDLLLEMVGNRQRPVVADVFPCYSAEVMDNCFDTIDLVEETPGCFAIPVEITPDDVMAAADEAIAATYEETNN